MRWHAIVSSTLLPAVPAFAAAEAPGSVGPEYSGAAWSPYLVGALIGVLSWLTFYFSGKPLGASSAYASLSGMLGKLFVPRHTESLKYYRDNEPKVDWGVMLLIGVVVGALFAAWHGSELTGKWVPTLWEARFGGDALPTRLIAAFIGGAFMAFGARLAGGCTSGHGISGALQLSVGSWVSLMCFFAGGIGTAKLLFRL